MGESSGEGKVSVEAVHGTPVEAVPVEQDPAAAEYLRRWEAGEVDSYREWWEQQTPEVQAQHRHPDTPADEAAPPASEGGE